ncbi:polysaccharide biosynthesis tyrosine autokinase [soil metagenome]
MKHQRGSITAGDQATIMAEAQDESFDLRRYINVVWYRKWIVVTTALAMLALAAVQLRKAIPQYSATAVIKYESKKPQILNFRDSAESGVAIDEMKTQIEVIQSPKLVRRVIDALGLFPDGQDAAPMQDGLLAGGLRELKNRVSENLVTYHRDELEPEVARMQRQEKEIKDKLKVAQKEGTKLIEITITDQTNRRAKLMADEFAQQYIASLMEEKTAVYKQANSWFAAQLDEAKDKLETAEKKMVDYQATIDVKVMQENQDIATQTLRSLSTEIEKVKNTIADFNARIAAGDNKDLLSALIDDDPDYKKLKDQRGDLELQRVKMVGENEKDHPDVKRLTREIAVVAQQIDFESTRIMNEAKAKKEIAEIRMQNLVARSAEQQTLIERIQKETINYRVLDRQVESSRAIYTSLLDQSKQVAVSSELNDSSVTVLSLAKIEEYPSSPRIMQTIALFFLFGISLGIGLVFAVDKLDRSIKDPRLVEDRLGLPTLGHVPFMGGAGGFRLPGMKKPARAPLVTTFDPKSAEAESFRVLRTSLQYSSAGQPPQIIMFSSCFPQEGKSTIASNLAVSYAQRGDRVLLIDGDLKMPTVHEIFGMNRMPGLSDVLTGQQTLEAVISPSTIERLDILPAGPSTPSPGDLLESDTMLELLKHLRTTYKAIIIDSAPLAGIADSLVLSRAVDGICVVVNRGKTPLDGLVKVVGLLDQLHAPILGVVYNARSRNTGEGLIRNYYHPGYTYGYGVKAEE